MSPQGFEFLHVGFSNVVATEELNNALKVVFDNATDWARYGGTNWILYTNQTPATWLANIQTVTALPAGFNVLIVPIDASRKWGLHQKWLWDWLAKPR
jgi:hypothetical protein